jgi:PTH1 family peptidyl-tRNA hydrolase
MKLFAGLGNPGAAYAGHRHNIGFQALDRIAADHGFPPWRARFRGLASEGRLGSERVILLKPQTFMNLSGDAVAEALRFFRLAPTDLVVFHDELDLAPGKLRVKQGGGHAGHNGLRSIHAHLGEGYARVRLGIGHPGHKDAVAGYVLHDFARADRDWLDPLLQGLSEGAPALAAGDGAGFQNAVALRTAPPRASTGRGAARASDPTPAFGDRPAAPSAPAAGAAGDRGRKGGDGGGDPGDGGGTGENQGGKGRDGGQDPDASGGTGGDRDGPPGGRRMSALHRLADRFRRP